MSEVDHWVVSHTRIQEHVVEGKRLGRHIKRDSRSEHYPYRQSGQPLQSNEVQRYIPILNQGQVGACTGNAETGEIGSGDLYAAALKVSLGLVLDETFALNLYSAAEMIDGDGPYPPNDNGSSGLSVSQAAKNGGWISGYVHCNGIQDLLDALSNGSAAIVGTNWYDSMDKPDSNGLVTISANASVRGGHEYLARKIDVDKQLIGFDNSWGAGWAVSGSFWYSWTMMERLLAEQGDATVSAPVGLIPS